MPKPDLPRAADAPGQVILAATPLGHSGDASARLMAALETSAVIAAEDTRRLRRLCHDLGIEPKGQVVSFFEANESARVPQLIEAVRSGDDVLVVSDAGMPSVSDPGFRLVNAAVECDLPITVLPGPSAVTTAIALSGLPVDRFCFEGFLPRKSGERHLALAGIADEKRTMVFFEAPHRIDVVLQDMAEVFGETRRAALCRELTKTYEEVRRGTLGELVEWAADGVRGEITLVVAGKGEVAPSLTTVELISAVALRESAGQSRKDAIREVARVCGIPKRVVFDAVVLGKSDKASVMSTAGPRLTLVSDADANTSNDDDAEDASEGDSE